MGDEGGGGEGCVGRAGGEEWVSFTVVVVVEQQTLIDWKELEESVVEGWKSCGVSDEGEGEVWLEWAVGVKEDAEM